MQAYEICVRKGLVKEQAFILGRMGNAKQALGVIINELGDIKEVISFRHYFINFLPPYNIVSLLFID